MDEYRFAGYRLIEFSPARKKALKEVGARLTPHRDGILKNWVSLQWGTWQPPGLSRSDLHNVFGRLLGSILNCMQSGETEICMDSLAGAGTELAENQFPFQALIISIHFLEKSYMPLLLDPPSKNAREWLIAVDEFLHAALAAVATAYFETHRRELLDQAEVGRIVQEGLLAQIPKRAADLEVAHVYMSASERAQVGGDLLDSFSIGSDEIAFIIGDLSGHGLEAAADSVMLRSLFRGFMRENPDPSDAMTRLNNVLNQELKLGQFATAIAIKYHAGRLSMVSAGHPLPVLCDESCRQLEELGGPALAVRDDADYTTFSISLQEGGIFVAFTDGLAEARRNKEMYGEQRIMNMIWATKNSSARAIVETLIDDALRFSGGKFADDVAVLVLKRREYK